MSTIAKVRRHFEKSIYKANKASGIDEVSPKVTLHKPDVLVSLHQSCISARWLKLTFAPVLRIDVDGR